MTAKVWFITGTSRGFGREWAIAALERGDKVAGTARDTSTLTDLTTTYGDSFLPLELDVNDREADFAAVKAAHEKFGRLDVVVNNAGYGHFGFLEEVTEEEARAQIETNLFGAMWVTQAAAPILREQGSGHVIQVSSIGGITAFPGIGMYHASKWGLEGFTQAFAGEINAFGVDVTIVEPGGFDTDWAGDSAKHSDALPAYQEAKDEMQRQRKARAASGPGDPHASAKAILELVDAEEPPLRCFFGDSPLDTATKEYESRLAVWREWDHVAKLAQG